MWEAGRDGHAAARASIDSGLVAAMTLLPKLDVVVANQYRDDPGTLAVWERDRRVDVARRARRRKVAPMPAEASAPAAGEGVHDDQAA